MPKAPPRSLHPGFECLVFTYQSDVWMRSKYQGTDQFDLRIGAGGAIAELRDAANGFERLLSPPFEHEVTDRVIQWTVWSDTIRHVTPSLSAFEQRFNITQAGTGDNVLSTTSYVRTDPGRCAVDVISTPKKQWLSALDPHIRSTLSTLVRYRMLGSGDVQIKRYLLVDDVYLDGAKTSFKKLYLEGWTPFARSAFDSLGYAFDKGGKPLHWEAAGRLRPYPNTLAKASSGYVAVFDSAQRASAPAVGVAFGARDACVRADDSCVPGSTGRHAINQMDWDTGIGVLPGVTFDNVVSGSLLRQELVLIPARGLNQYSVSRFEHYARTVEPPSITPPGHLAGTEDGDIAAILALHRKKAGSATDHLAPLLTGSRR